MQPDVRERRFRTSYRTDDEKEWEVSMKKGKMKLMIAPLQGSVNDTEQVLEKIVGSCRKAITQKADFLCFPELILNGADPEALGLKIYDRAQPAHGRLHQWLEHLSHTMGIYIAAGMVQQSVTPGRLYSSYIICCPDGHTKNVFQKRYFDDLDQLYMTGSTDKNPVSDPFAFGTVTYALGADMDTLEYVQQIAAAQTALILAASYGRKRNAGELAKSCGCYVAYVGNGYGAIYDPDGKLLAEADGEEGFTYEIMI